MPLTFNYRDEHNERINNALQRLRVLSLVPGGWDNDAVNELMKVFLLRVDDLSALETQAFVTFILRYKVDFENMELLADALVNLSEKPGYGVFAAHALGLYEHIQQANDTFSVQVASKIKVLKQA